VRIVLSFISGMVICGLLLLGARMVLPTRADTDDAGETSDNVTQRLIDLMPDIEKIYKESLTTPFRMAESKIYDEDIAEFYGTLLDNTGLRGTEEGTN